MNFIRQAGAEQMIYVVQAGAHRRPSPILYAGRNSRDAMIAAAKYKDEVFVHVSEEKPGELAAMEGQAK